MSNITGAKTSDYPKKQLLITKQMTIIDEYNNKYIVTKSKYVFSYTRRQKWLNCTQFWFQPMHFTALNLITFRTPTFWFRLSIDPANFHKIVCFIRNLITGFLNLIFPTTPDSYNYGHHFYNDDDTDDVITNVKRVLCFFLLYFAYLYNKMIVAESSCELWEKYNL